MEGFVSNIKKLYNLTTININGQYLIVPGKPGILGDFVRVRIRSRDVIITPIKINSYIAENILVGTILTIDIEKISAFSELIVALENK